MLSTERKIRPRKCKAPACRAAFVPARPLQAACCPQCAEDIARHRREKETALAARKAIADIRARKLKARTRSYYVKAAQVAFNAFVRARDAGLPCISCGSMPEQRYGGAMDCGHYRSTGAAPHLRYTPENAASQCVKCNRHLSGNAVAFRRGLVARIGLEAVEALEADHEPRKWSIGDLAAIRREFVAKTKALALGAALEPMK